MVRIRHAQHRGLTQIDWLDSRHTFSFGDYQDRAHMGFASLRVMNDDRIGPGGGFGLHPHRDMEILTFVLEGALEHRDNLGHREILRPGEVQRMSAGTGIWHSEFNASKDAPVHLYQVWLLPREKGLTPSYEQKSIATGNGLIKAASAGLEDGSVQIQQDAEVYVARLGEGENAVLPLRPGRKVWVQLMQGSAHVQGQELKEGDGAAITEEAEVTLRGMSAAQVLLFNLK